MRPSTARVTATLRIMVEEKVRLLFGSDTPSGDGGIGNPPGLNGRLELSRWAEAGVPLSQIHYHFGSKQGASEREDSVTKFT